MSESTSRLIVHIPDPPYIDPYEGNDDNDGSNDIKPCYDRDTTLSLRLRDWFHHLQVQALVATPALLTPLRTHRVRETLYVHLLERSINITTFRLNLIDLPVH